ncbi:MAG: ACT domain-containing protein [Phycisphaerales bacterium]|nr:MAG: ACT domain-containing protein [Phycisphaerales bacterium]
MPYEISRADVWVGEIEDRVGGLAEKLEILRDAGANLEFTVVRRLAEKPGKAVLFCSPLRGAAAKEAGLKKSSSMCTVRIEGPDRPGLSAKISRTVANEGISLRGLSGATLGDRNVIYLSFHSVPDANKAALALQRAFSEEQVTSP